MIHNCVQSPTLTGTGQLRRLGNVTCSFRQAALLLHHHIVVTSLEGTLSANERQVSVYVCI